MWKRHPWTTLTRWRKHALACSALIVLFPFGQAQAFNTVTVDVGYGLEDTRLLRLNFSTGEHWRSAPDRGWYWTRDWEGNISYWYLYKLKEGEDHMIELGLTPNFRLAHEQAFEWGRPYLEIGVGVHLLSNDRIGTRELGGSFQFGTHVGFGVSAGRKEQFELAWRIEHLSNAGLREPNPGINFSMVRIGYRW